MNYNIEEANQQYTKINTIMKVTILFSVICLIIPSDAEDKCKSDLRRCLATMSLGGQGGIPTSLEQVNNLCRAYKSGMECVDAYKRECLPTETRLAAERQMASAKFFMKLLCNVTDFKNEYLNHTDCFAGVSKDWDRCNVVFLDTVRHISEKKHAIGATEEILDLCCARYGFNRCISMASKAKCDKSAAVMLRRISETLSYNDRCDDRFSQTICSATSVFVGSYIRLIISLSIIVYLINGLHPTFY